MSICVPFEDLEIGQPIARYEFNKLKALFIANNSGLLKDISLKNNKVYYYKLIWNRNVLKIST